MLSFFITLNTENDGNSLYEEGGAVITILAHRIPPLNDFVGCLPKIIFVRRFCNRTEAVWLNICQGWLFFSPAHWRVCNNWGEKIACIRLVSFTSHFPFSPLNWLMFLTFNHVLHPTKPPPPLLLTSLFGLFPSSSWRKNSFVDDVQMVTTFKISVVQSWFMHMYHWGVVQTGLQHRLLEELRFKKTDAPRNDIRVLSATVLYPIYYGLVTYQTFGMCF